MNKSKARGTWAESAVVKWLHANGYPDARRQVLTGSRDQGDLWVTPGVIAEVKVRAGAAGVGQPGEVELARWMAETEAERRHANASLAVLIVKRCGTTDPGRWFAYIPASSLAHIFGEFAQAVPSATLCMSVATWAYWLRARFAAWL